MRIAASSLNKNRRSSGDLSQVSHKYAVQCGLLGLAIRNSHASEEWATGTTSFFADGAGTEVTLLSLIIYVDVETRLELL